MIKIIILLIGLLLSNVSFIDANMDEPSSEGSIIFAPLCENNTYRMDYDYSYRHIWYSQSVPEKCAYLIDDYLYRASRGNGGGEGGFCKMDNDSNILWECGYPYMHHDIEVLPDGNVLVLGFDVKNLSESIIAGRIPFDLDAGISVDYIVEIEKDTCDVVWEWHVWDYLIQDYDPTKDNYGVVYDHPELIDINYVPSSGGHVDLTHFNSVDYNAELNQVLISCRSFNEVWVIERGTAGGLVDRWGNPEAYRHGDINDRKLYGQHDANWITEGLDGAGNILVFSNGISESEVIEFTFDSDDIIWSYSADGFFSDKMGGCQRLPSGNTLICSSMTFEIFEVTSSGNIVWSYTHSCPMFKAQWIPDDPVPPPPPIPIGDLDCIGNIRWFKPNSSSEVTSTFIVENICENESYINWTVESFPSWGSWSFNPVEGYNLTYSTVVEVSCVVPEEVGYYNGIIRVVNMDNSSDFDNVPVHIVPKDDEEGDTFRQYNASRVNISGVITPP